MSSISPSGKTDFPTQVLQGWQWRFENKHILGSAPEIFTSEPLAGQSTIMMFACPRDGAQRLPKKGNSNLKAINLCKVAAG